MAKTKAKLTVQARIDAAALAALDRIGGKMEPPASRSKMIDLAVRKFVAAHDKK